MGIWIAIAIGVFIVGSIMGLKPSARETMRDNLRMAARRVGVQPKLVACPDWIMGDTGERGKGMMAQYGVVIQDAKMRPCDYQVIEGKWRPFTGHYPANFALDNREVDLPASIATTVKGLSCKANFVCIYWQENSQLGMKSELETTEKDLIMLKSKLHDYAKLVQNN